MVVSGDPFAMGGAGHTVITMDVVLSLAGTALSYGLKNGDAKAIQRCHTKLRCAQLQSQCCAWHNIQPVTCMTQGQ